MLFRSIALPGIVLTAALFLRALQQLVTGPPGELTPRFSDAAVPEWLPVTGLLLLSLAVGVLPGPLLDLITPASTAVVDLVSR